MSRYGQRSARFPKRLVYAALAAATVLAGGGAVCYGITGRTAEPGPYAGEALCQLNRRVLERVAARLARTPGDPSLQVQLARVHLNHAHLLAAMAYERRHPLSESDSNDDYLAWRRRYLAGDPEGSVTGTLRVVRRALRQEPPTLQRTHLLSILSYALCYLGRHREEATALQEAHDLAPNQQAFAGRLIQAYGESRQFHRAEAVLTTIAGEAPAIVGGLGGP